MKRQMWRGINIETDVNRHKWRETYKATEVKRQTEWIIEWINTIEWMNERECKTVSHRHIDWDKYTDKHIDR